MIDCYFDAIVVIVHCFVMFRNSNWNLLSVANHDVAVLPPMDDACCYSEVRRGRVLNLCFINYRK